MEDQEITNRKSVGQRSAECELAIKFLRTKAVGAVISYQEGAISTGFDWREFRNILNTARNAVWSEGYYYLCLRGVGYKRVDEVEASGYGVSEVRGIYKKARRASRKMAQIDLEKLPRDKKSEHLVTMAQFGVLIHATKPKTSESMLRGVQSQPANPLNLHSALQALMDAKKGA